MIQFAYPPALVGLAALAPLLLIARHSLTGLAPGRLALATALRATVLICLTLAAAGLQLVRRVDATGLVWVLDRSASVPEAEQRRSLEFVAAAATGMRPDDRAGLVVAGRTPRVETPPRSRLAPTAIESLVDPRFTDLAAALRLAAALAPTDARRRLVLLSDGNENLGDAVGEARLAGALGLPIDVVPLVRPARGEVVARQLQLPGEVQRGDTVAARLQVHSDSATEAAVTLLRDNTVVATTTARLNPGPNTIALPPVTLTEPGGHGFSAEIEAAVDGEPRNNRALGYTVVRGERRVLLVDGAAGRSAPLARALRGSGLEVTVIAPGRFPGRLPELAAYDCLLLVNVSALELSETQLALIRGAVREIGLGLIMIGGDESFGVGGYYRTPVEEALPVDMDIRKLEHLPNVGVAIVIDQSGSMALTEGGVEKIQLANEAAIALVSLLGPRDQVTVIATDEVAKPVTGPTMVAVTNKPALIDEIARIRAGGGGIYCYNGLRRAADLLRPAATKLKHIILFADAADSEQQEGCRELARELAAEKITLTVVGLGRATDPDVAFLENLARLGRGRYYLTHQASALPRIFTREAILASRSQVVERTFTPLLQTDVEPLRGLTAMPPLHGYVACTAKPTAEVGLLADPRHKDPLLALWQYGLGRAVAFTSDAGARWATDWLAWPGYAKFWSQTVRWALRRTRRGEFEARVVCRYLADADELAAWRLQQGEAKVIVDAVNPRGEFINQLRLRGTAVAPDGRGTELTLSQTAPGRYEASFAVDQVGVWLVNVADTGGGSQTVGFALGYPVEWGEVTSDEALLQQLADLSGGRRLTSPGEVFEPRGAPARAPADVWPALVAAALLLFCLDVAARRVAVDPRRFRVLLRRPAREAPRTTSQLLDRRTAVRQQTARPTSSPAPPEPRPAPSADTPSPAEDARPTLARLKEARERARHRTGEEHE